MKEKKFRSLHVLRMLGRDVSKEERKREEERQKQDGESTSEVFVESLMREISDPN